MEGLH
jgi:hypothetical protein